MVEKTFKQVCKCENCGNEAEMQVTCTLSPGNDVSAPPKPVAEADADGKEKIQGHAVCSHCGSEADIWVDVP